MLFADQGNPGGLNKRECMLRRETMAPEAVPERLPCSLQGRGLPHALRILAQSVDGSQNCGHVISQVINRGAPPRENREDKPYSHGAAAPGDARLVCRFKRA